jgi:putative proteasome-type protease
MHLYSADSYSTGQVRRIERDDPFYEMISSGWGEALRAAFDRLPAYSLD